MTECKVTTMDTWLGPLTIVQTAKGVRFVDLDDGARQFAREAEGQFVRIPGLPESTAEFEAYFSGTLREFTSPVDLVGTPFQLRCWEALRLIPYGQTITYAQEGQRIGTRGFRAVGQANRRNPVAILIPCHRVIGLNGPGGYFGAKLWMKRALLEFEGVCWPEAWGHEVPENIQNECRARIDGTQGEMLN